MATSGNQQLQVYYWTLSVSFPSLSCWAGGCWSLFIHRQNGYGSLLVYTPNDITGSLICNTTGLLMDNQEDTCQLVSPKSLLWPNLPPTVSLRNFVCGCWSARAGQPLKIELTPCCKLEKNFSLNWTMWIPFSCNLAWSWLHCILFWVQCTC